MKEKINCAICGRFDDCANEILKQVDEKGGMDKVIFDCPKMENN